MSLRCALGIHRWIPRARAITPRREVARIPIMGHLFQHPSTWPTVAIPYTARFEKVGEQCKRCGVRR